MTNGEGVLAEAQMSYSQYGEDQAVADVFGDFVGRVLDIGAWAAETFSNSRALIERGWEALLIEPSPEPFLGLLKFYGNNPKVKLVCAAVGFDRHALEMYATADAVTTSNREVYEKWRNTVSYYGKFYTGQLTIEEILNQFGGFDFINFDAEGMSVDLCKRYLKLGQRPRCICVEHDDRIQELLSEVTAIGYRAVLVNGTNCVLAI